MGTPPGSVPVISVAGAWYVDDEIKLTRSTFFVRDEVVLSSKEEGISEKLESVLRQLLSADASARARVSPILPRRKDRFGQAIYSEFERSLQYPKS